MDFSILSARVKFQKSLKCSDFDKINTRFEENGILKYILMYVPKNEGWLPSNVSYLFYCK